MLRATLKGMASRKARLILTSLAVVLGTMFVAAAMIMTASLERSVGGVFSDAYTEVDIIVTPEDPDITADEQFMVAGATMPAATVDEIRNVPGVEAVDGEVLGPINAIGSDGKVVAGFAPTLGFTWESLGTDRSDYVQVREGRGPQTDDEVAVTGRFVTESGLSLGDTVTVYSYTADPADYTIVGVYGYEGDRDSLAGENGLAFTVAEAQRLITGGEDVYTSASVYGDATVEDVAAAVGPGHKVQTGEEAGAEAAEGLAEFAGFMGYIFLGFGLVAVFVSVFLIINTFTIIVAQRQRELALMRAIGAERAQVVRSVLVEALVIGVIASIVGLGLGVLLGWGLSAMVGGFMFSGLAVDLVVPATTAWALVIGIGVTLLSALMPALRASKVPPVAAMRDAANPPKPLRTITIAGAAVTAAGIALLALGLTDNLGGNNLVGVLAGVLVSFVGITLLTPILSRPLVALLGRLVSFSFPGKLGRLNASRNPRRTAITAAALMIAVALVTAIASLASSMRATGEEVLDSSLSSDLIVAGTQGGASVPSFSRETLAELRTIPDVDAVADVYADFFGTRVDGQQTEMAASEDIATALRVFGGTVAEGSITNLGADEIVVDAQRAEDFGVGIGDTVNVRFGSGSTAELTVAAILEDNMITNGWWVAPERIEEFAIPKPLQAFIDVADGADAAVVQDRVRQVIADEPEVTVTNNAEFIDEQLGILNVLLGAVQVLLALAMIIAVIGVVNTLVLSVLERTRELGLLRAVGMTRGQARRMITVESVIICLFGAVLGITVGIGLGWAVQQGLESEGLTTFALPWALIAAYLVAALVVGLLAAIAPAARAAKLNVLNAIAYE